MPTSSQACELAIQHPTCGLWPVQANDFGSEVIPGAKDMGMHIQAYLYDGYWEDIGTVEAFYEANLALTDSPKPKFRWASPFMHPIAAEPRRRLQHRTCGILNTSCGS